MSSLTHTLCSLFYTPKDSFPNQMNRETLSNWRCGRITGSEQVLCFWFCNARKRRLAWGRQGHGTEFYAATKKYKLLSKTASGFSDLSIISWSFLPWDLLRGPLVACQSLPCNPMWYPTHTSLEKVQVMPPGDQVFNHCLWCYSVTKFAAMAIL